jgi:N utilization substance protein B
MSHRHLARSLVMQVLFAWDFQGRNEDVLDSLADYILDEFGAGVEDSDFIKAMVKGIATKRAVLDDIIGKAAPAWPVDKISGVDRNALRIGLYELLFGDRTQVPPKVAINEAIELAKSYGGENSGRFINGVLGTVYKELGEPDKDQLSKKKELTPEELEKLPIEKKGGAVVYSIDESGEVRFALVHDVFGYWTLSKGTIEEGESAEEGTIREVGEEIGIGVEIIEKLGENEYIANHPERGKIRKQVSYFLAKAEYQPLTLEVGTGGLDDAKWFTLSEIPDLRMYADVTELMRRSIENVVASVV